jgi:hypothetical protein
MNKQEHCATVPSSPPDVGRATTAYHMNARRRARVIEHLWQLRTRQAEVGIGPPQCRYRSACPVVLCNSLLEARPGRSVVRARSRAVQIRRRRLVTSRKRRAPRKKDGEHARGVLRGGGKPGMVRRAAFVLHDASSRRLHSCGAVGEGAWGAPLFRSSSGVCRQPSQHLVGACQTESWARADAV